MAAGLQNGDTIAMTVNSSYSGSLRRRIPPFKSLCWLVALLLLLSMASLLINEASRRVNGVSLLWLPNALLIGALLCAPRVQWPAMLTLGFLIDATLNIGLGNHLPISLALSGCNITEVIIASTLMYSTVAPNPDLTYLRQIRSFLLYGVLLAPASASLLASYFLYHSIAKHYLLSLQYWFAADMLGIATVTPLYLSFFHGKGFSRRPWPEIFGLFAIATAISVAIFAQTRLPLLWMVMLCLLLLGVRLGFTASALALLIVTFIGGGFTLSSRGPVAMMPDTNLSQRIFMFQLFILCTMTTLYLTEVVMERGRRLRRNLEDSESRFRLLAEASRDVIVMADLNGRRKYVSPAATELLGWHAEELLGRHFNHTVHPEDQAAVEKHVLDSMESSVPGRPLPIARFQEVLAFRAQKKDGKYLWLEAKVRTFRTPNGMPAGYVFTIRDINARKAAEDERHEAFQIAERQATVDGLTGVANRYKLDATLERGWQRAFEQASPISLLLIDVDRFKDYNDLYGHLAGDECLRSIAKTIQGVLRRSNDLLARYGGEEFVAILPDTTAEDAAVLSELVRSAVERSGIPHAGNPHGVVTISIGCATHIPEAPGQRSNLVRAADVALYRAKTAGRNRTFVA
jgi:diguanylate cyclase (GGDEF)-like protein/PAS domain S-box-containing protein